jgi:hypothetical protein
MIYDSEFTVIAYDVLKQIGKYKGETYAASFRTQVDAERLGAAIQCAIAHRAIRELTQQFMGELPTSEALFPLAKSLPEKPL